MVMDLSPLLELLLVVGDVYFLFLASNYPSGRIRSPFPTFENFEFQMIKFIPAVCG